MEEILKSLSPVQRQAVEATDGPLMVVASAGSGKTRVLVCRLACLLEKERVPSGRLLALTFTQKAAEEIRERVSAVTSGRVDCRALWVGTFHSLARGILKEWRKEAELPGDFGILSEPDGRALVRALLKENPPAERSPTIRSLIQRISLAKNTLGVQSHDEWFTRFHENYQEALARRRVLDFDDLLLRVLALFEGHPEVLGKLRDRYSHTMVDEYQDITPVQYRLIQVLAGTFPNLCVVGDADQAIYAFRGAHVSIFLSFREDFPNAREIQLEENFRSSRNVVEAARIVIRNNKRRLDRDMFTCNPPGDKIRCCTMLNERTEARFIVREVERLMGGTGFETFDRGTLESGERARIGSFGETAVLYRFHELGRALREAFQNSGIPFQVVRSASFFEKPEASFFLRLLEGIHDPARSVATVEVLRLGVEGVGEATAAALEKAAAARSIPVQRLMKDPSILSSFPERQAGALRGFAETLEEMRKRAERVALDRLLLEMHASFGRHFHQGKEVSPKECGICLELVPAAASCGGGPACEVIPSFLECQALSRGRDRYRPDAERVTLMTLHASKGLEFPVVFIIGLEEGIFPVSETEDLEEERRLLYVGLTRAMKRLYLSHAKSRAVYGERGFRAPSRFLSEVPEGVVEHFEDPAILRKEQREKERRERGEQLTLF